MSSEWTPTKLSALGTFERGKSKHRPRDAAHLYGGPYPFIQTGDVTAAGGRITSYRQSYSEAGLAQSRLWPSGTLAITIAANIAETALLTFPACFPDSVVGFAADGEKADVRFIEYLLRAMRERVQQRAYGSVQENINLEVLRDLKFPVPPLRLQVEIADVLSLFDDRIALLRETNATLEGIAQALFKSWFVDFDPVRAKQQGLAPAGMDEATAALFPDSFEDSALGLMPKGWQIETVDDLCDVITNGGTPSRSNGAFWTGGTMPWFKTGDFADGFLLAPAERISEAAIAGSSVKVLPANAILMAIYAAPTVGRLGVLTEAATFNQACTGMVAKASVGPWYLLLTLFFGRAWFNSRANGAAQQNISKAIVASYQAVVATAPLLTRFHEIADGLYCRIRANSQQAQTLATLRDTLLPRLISGRLRLPEAQAQIEVEG